MLFVLLPLFTIFPLTSATYNEKGWKAAQKYLTEYMDPSIEACANFSGLVCGNFGNASDSSYQTWDDVRPVQYIKTMSAAIKGISATDTRKYARLLRHYHDQCMNTTNDTQTYKAVHDLVATILGILPALNESSDYGGDNKSHDDLWYALGRIHREFGEAIFLAPTYLVMGEEGKRFGYLSFETISQGLSSFSINLGLLKNVTLQLAEEANISVNKTRLDEIMLETKNYVGDWNVAMLMITDSGLSYTDFPGNVTDDVFPGLSFYLRGFLTDEAKATWFTNPSSKVAFNKLDALKAVMDVFRRHPTRAIKTAVFGWFITKVSQRIAGLRFDTGVDEPSFPKWWQGDWNDHQGVCVEYAVQQVIPAAARVYLEHLGEDIFQWRQEFIQISKNVFSAMRLLLNSVDYMSPATKERINKKIDAIYLIPAIPSWIADEESVMANSIKYNDSEPFVINAIRRNGALVQNDQKRVLVEPETANADPPPTFEINSVYLGVPGSPYIEMYLGYNLPPYFSQHYPLSLKYAQTGFVIGHEIMHAFDPNNVLRSAGKQLKDLEAETDPNLKKDEADIYQRHTQCLMQQYSSTCYKSLGSCQVGSRAMGDNVADIGGLKTAFAAYQFAKALQKEEEPPVPGLEQYSNDQLFFMTFRRFYCFRNEPTQAWLGANHSPSGIRAGAALRNNPHFADSFQCEVGSNEAPLRPCEMWGDLLSPL